MRTILKVGFMSGSLMVRFIKRFKYFAILSIMSFSIQKMKMKISV